ncbi:MAG: DUF6655 family protein [Planctomycetota bacterium]
MQPAYQCNWFSSFAFGGSRFLALVLLGSSVVGLVGCGSTKSYTATDQLLMSDAVDATVSQLDFRPLTGRKVYFDVTFIKTTKSPLLIDSDYVISSMRQQMVADGVYLVETRDEADVIAEGRIGALGLDGHSVTYGLPASNTISTATSVFTSTPLLPAFPEMSFARHEAKSGAAKIAVFAYDRDSRAPVWQSGVAKSSSSARDTWVLGVGPWQRGTIYEGTRFAGSKIEGSNLVANNRENPAMVDRYSNAFSNYLSSKTYVEEPKLQPNAGSLVELASAEAPSEASGSDTEKGE